MPFIAALPQAAAAGRDWLDTIVGVASALNTLMLLALLLVIAPASWAFIKSLRQFRALLDRAYDDLKPFIGHANSVAASVDEITSSVRAEAKQVTDSIAQANQGISRAIESTEKRISKFGALVDVAQQEVERVFLSTAATVEGVKATAKAVVGSDDDEETSARPSRPRVRRRRKRRD